MSDGAQTYDLVIVGSGAASMSAGLVARRAGKSVIVLEKAEMIGGSTALSGGVMWIPNSPTMKRAGYSDSYEAAREYLDACLGEPTLGSSSARREAFLKEGPRAVEFVETLGMPLHYPPGYSDYYENERPAGLADGRSLVTPVFNTKELGAWGAKLRRQVGMPAIRMDEAGPLLLNGRTWKSKVTSLKVAWRMFKGRLGADLVGNGASLYGWLLKIALREGVTIRLESPVTGFVEQDGRIAGVVVRHGGKSVTIGAREGVILDAGGFSHNAEMRERYQPKPGGTSWTHANPGDTGEIMQQVMALGAATEEMDHAVWVATTVLPDGTRSMLPADLQKPHSIMVDSSGARYVNEATDYMAVGQAMFRRHQTVPAVPSWVILDSRNKHRYFFASHPPGPPPKSWIESGYMKRADTLEDLARQCEIDAAGLKTTIERFNRFARAGVDEDFGRGRSAWHRYFGDPAHKPNASLGTIEKPPFYATKVFPGDVGTFGGLVTDEYARVLKEDGQVIPGLYACGNLTSSVMGRAYPGAGASIAPSFVFGYVAAKHALRVND
jgi:3-oxosteroid 1-dehydrogenase